MKFTDRADALPRKKRALQGRRLVVVEIESIAGGAVRTNALASWARKLIEEAIALKPDEQVIIGARHASVLAAGTRWPGARLVTARDSDGTQRELLQILQSERIAGRFDELVLTSGNGVFTEAIARLGVQGVRVTVVAWPESLSKRLRMAAAETVLLERTMMGLGGVA
jgi:hypothetical protein